MLGRVVQRFHLGIAETAREFAGVAQPHFAFAHDLAGRDQRAGTDETVFLHHRAVQHDRAHADQRRVLDGAGVDHRLVADGHVLADAGGEPAQLGVRAVVAHVHDAAVLDIRPRADANEIHVAADHRGRPDRHVVAQHDVADDDRGGVDVDPFAQRGQVVEIGADKGMGIGHGRI
jgi:hypothetical protein